MPVVSLYLHGVTGGVPPMHNSHPRVQRGDVGGWSPGATRRNTQFLYSVREKLLDGQGFAVTLTLRECPPDAQAWHRVRRAWEMRLRRAGMIRVHWVTEWQRRGVPHIHAAVWFPTCWVDDRGVQASEAFITSAWMLAGGETYGAGNRGQDAHPITGAVGWFQYLSKHAARGLKHYQRSPENIPEAWKSKTGRMWGHGGDWPVREKIRLNLENERGDGGFFAFRRLVRSWRLADARAAGDRRRVKLARRMLSANNAATSRVRGVSEWIDHELTLSMLGNLAVRGYSILHDEGRQASPQGVTAVDLVPSEVHNP
uniref:Replication-associated protein ORF2/G2P domain-containing protein n=1 Tax=uncultured prokaryote TaxID=198431 RepID=A0A0H5QJN8_9ZZZZ|nr:hypothetical protein [uncultured prokaryote]